MSNLNVSDVPSFENENSQIQDLNFLTISQTSRNNTNSNNFTVNTTNLNTLNVNSAFENILQYLTTQTNTALDSLELENLEHETHENEDQILEELDFENVHDFELVDDSNMEIDDLQNELVHQEPIIEQSIHLESIDQINQDQIVRNLLDLINPRNEGESRMIVNEFLENIHSNNESSIQFLNQIQSLRGNDTSQLSYYIINSINSPTTNPVGIGKNTGIIDSLTGAPLPESAKTVTFQDNEVYEVDNLSTFLTSMKELRSPLTGRLFTEKEIEKISESQTPIVKERLKSLLSLDVSTITKPISIVKTIYFEDTIYTMILHCFTICELDEVANVHVSVQEFNKRYYPIIIRSLSGISLSNPTKMLKVCKNVIEQIKSVLQTIEHTSESNEEDDDNYDKNYIYHPVLLSSVCHAITSVCNLSISNYFSAASHSKLSSKICEVPIARIVQSSYK